MDKILKIQAEIGVLRKDSKNPFYKSNYLSLAELLCNLQPLLEKYGLTVIQLPCVQDVAGQPIRTLITRVYGDKLITESNCPLLLATDDMQKLGMAITYARRYSLTAIFNIQEEDDDGNSLVSPPKAINQTAKPVSSSSSSSSTNCPSCGAEMKLSKQGKLYCSALCWKNGQQH